MIKSCRDILEEEENETNWKKYQWISFCEILAMAADQYMLKPHYGKRERRVCNCEWYAKFRNIDPSLIIYPFKMRDYSQPERPWLSDFEYLPPEENSEKWILEEPDFINKLLNFKDADGYNWMSLCYFPFWNEYKEDTENWKEESKKQCEGMLILILLKRAI